MSSPGAMSDSARETRVSGFAPVAGEQPRVLILGSMPGVASLDAHEYYAMPRNAFWPIMGRLFDAGFALAYAQRLVRLQAAGVALWDVLASCVRPGSLDAAIDVRSAVVNNFGRLFADRPTIERVFFNGKAAADIYRRRVLPALDAGGRDVALCVLPSTSPAHAALSFDEKLRRWAVVRDAVGSGRCADHAGG